MRRRGPAWRSLGVSLGAVVVGATAPRAAAQAIGHARSSPLVACCAPPMSAVPTVDTLPGLLRDAAMASALGELPTRWRRYATGAAEQYGEWRTVQEPRRLRTVVVEGEGGRATGGWYLAGGARLARTRETDVAWRNQSAASLDGVYVWADSVGGTWRGDDVALHAAAASPTWRGVTLGVPLSLALGQAARRNDPRPLSRRRVMAAQPAVHVAIGAHQFGLMGTLGSQREDLEIGGGLSPEVPVVFRLRGIATFDRTQLNSAERALLGRTRGGRAIWAHRGARASWVAGGGVQVETDKVRDGIATPAPGGETHRLRHDVHAAWQQRRALRGMELRARWQREDARGTDPVFRAVNAIRTGQRTDWTAVWWHGPRPLAASWRAELAGAAARLSVRDVAGEAAWEVTRWPIAAVLEHRRPSRARHVWFGRLGLSHTAVTGSSVTVTQASRITPLFAVTDHAAHAAPTTVGHVRIGLDRRAGPSAADGFSRLSVGWEAARARLTTPAAAWAHRQSFTLMLELL